MDQQAARKITRLQELAAGDERYMELLAAFRRLYGPVENMLAALPGEQRNALVSYLELFTQLQLRLLEIACGSMEFSTGTTNPQ